MTELFDVVKNDKFLSDGVILSGYRGSIAHGTYRESPDNISDKDVMYVVVPREDYYFGCESRSFPSSGTHEIKNDGWDIVAYEARKFISMLAKGNPNVLTMLWLESRHYLHVSFAGRMLLDNRLLFIGKHVYYPFIGYAHGQLHRMTCHVPTANAYMGNKRKMLIEKFGYDTKEAAHLIRLLRMGIEFLGSGELKVFRENDVEELLEIKAGAWSLEKVQKEANRLFKLAQEAYDISLLPLKPNMKLINELSVEVVKGTLWEYRANNEN
jgi:predicted nucleotidyltransferase